MTKTPAVRGMLAGIALLLGSVTQIHAQQKTPPSPAEMLHPKLAPKHDDIVITTPTTEELKSCSVELVSGGVPNSGGWLLLDNSKKTPDGRPQLVRRFFDSNGDGKVDVWSYYKDGIEVYREFDTTLKNAQPNNFRWLNGGGTKWGVGGIDPRTGKGYVEYWRMISAEEVGYEAFHAVARKDFARLKLLFINDAEMQALKLSPATMKRIVAAQQGAPKKFDDLIKKVSLDKARFERVEGYPASCSLEEGPAGETSVIKYFSRAIQFEVNKKVDWIYTGEMIQIGMAWRLVDGPTDVDPINEGGPPVIRPNLAPELQKLFDDIAELDKNPPAPPPIIANNPKVDAYLRQRIALVQKILPLDKADQRETWYKQLFDNLTSLAQNSGADADTGMLKRLKDDVVSKMPKSNLAAYGVYRHAWTNYAIQLAKALPKDMPAIQEKWLETLSDFVKNYATAEDTPEALHQLAIGSEFSGKDEEAKRWYTQLFNNFPQHGLTPRARGSVDRLNLPGKELKLSAPLLNDPAKSFDIAQLKGKIVIVHYWASYSTNYEDDFVRLKRLVEQVGSKQGVELVCVNLDDDATRAREALKKVQGQGIHLYQPPSNNSGGGLNSPLAVQYGIHMLPTMFMVGRDGRVTNRALQIGDIETELKKVQ
jgi:Thioredoxin-like